MPALMIIFAQKRQGLMVTYIMASFTRMPW
jgi:hypothetical protein